jgi:membrane protease YdiL (CAAX protease family)
MTTTTTRRSSPAAVIAARREIVVFLVLQFAFLACSSAIAITEGVDVRRIDEASAVGQASLYLSGLGTVLAVLVARLVTAGTLRRPGWGFRRVRPRIVLGAWVYGLIVPLVAYVVVWGSGAGGFDGDALAAGLGLTGPAGAAASAVVALTVLVVPFTLLALSEDLGWRGLLVTRLAAISGPRTVVLVSGIAWSAAHYPLMIWIGGSPDGVSTAYAIAMFTIGTTAGGAVLAWMQLRWGIWPGVVAHGAFNVALYYVAEPATVVTGGATHWIATETGLAVVLASVLAAVLWLRRAPLVAVARPGGRGTAAAVRGEVPR